MAHLRLSFLGSFQVTLDGQPVTTFRSTNVRGLLAYLAIESAQPHAREALAGLFWPEEPEEVALQNLRQSLYQLRRTLGDEEKREELTPPFLLVTRPAVQFNPETDYWLDVAEFLNCLDAGQLEQAATLYRGELLKGLFISGVGFEEWLMVLRERLHRLALDALYQLTQQYQEWGDYAKAQMCAQQQLALEPWREEAHRQLMQALSLSGQRSAALAQYEACRRALTEELDVEPEVETIALYHRIRDLGAQASLPAAVLAGKDARAPRRRLIVGREKERAELQLGFQSAQAGRGSLLCVTGEPGIGKTSLVEDFLTELQNGGERCLIGRGRCSERLAGEEAYLPWLDALSSLLHSASGEWVSRRIKLLAPSWYLQVAALATDDSSVAPVRERGAASQERMKRELSALLEDLSRLRPLLLFFDDMHWADASTIDLLAYLAGKFAGMHVLIVAAYRPSDLLLAKHLFSQVKLELQTRGDCHEIGLEFLSRDEVGAYLALQFPEHRFPAELAALIHAKTEGNPLFIVDLVRYLRDRQVIAEDRGTWALARPIPDIESELPESVRSMIERKFAQLGEEDHRLLLAASVEGHEFDSAVVSRALAADAAEIEERLEALERAHALVRLIGEETFPDRTPTLRYRFVHVLYQNALYGSLQPTRKAQLSSKVAQALLGYYGESNGAVASELAHLYEAAREFERAADYYLLAARNAAQAFAHSEATILARRGLEVLEMLPETAERARRELPLQLTLGFAVGVTKGYAAPEVEESMARARELCGQLGEAPQTFPAIWGLLMYYLVTPDYRSARQMSEQLLRMAESLRDPLLLTGAHAALGFTLLHLGELAPSHEHLEQAIALHDPSQHNAYLSLYSLDPGLYSVSNTIRSLWLLGYPEQARRRMREAVSRAREAGDPRSLAFALHLEVVFLLFYREMAEALEQAEVCIAHCEEHGIAQEREWTRVYRGAALVEQGQLQEGITEMRESIAALRRMHAENTFPHFLALLADALGKAGQINQSLAALEEALDVARRTGDHCYEAEVYRLKGELSLNWGSRNADCGLKETDVLPNRQSAFRNPQLEAESCFRQAIEIARRQSAKSLELRAAMSLCRLLQQQDRREEGREMLVQVHGWFTEGFDTADLKEAEAMLRADEMSWSHTGLQTPVKKSTDFLLH